MSSNLSSWADEEEDIVEQSNEIIIEGVAKVVDPVVTEVREVSVDNKINTIDENETETEAEADTDIESIDGVDTVKISVEDILKLDSEVLSIHDILKYQSSLAYFSQCLYENNDPTVKKMEKLLDIAKYFTWVSSAARVLAKRMNQILPPKHDIGGNSNSINRSSYNFCPSGYKCDKFYQLQHPVECCEHHYVHSIVAYDGASLVSYLEYLEVDPDVSDKENLPKDMLYNIHTSIKTLSFVIRHMFKEYGHIHSSMLKPETYHRDNLPLASKLRYGSPTQEKRTFNESRQKSTSSAEASRESSRVDDTRGDTRTKSKSKSKSKNKVQASMNVSNRFALLDD